MALRREIRAVDHDCWVSVRGTRLKTGPWGLFGGHEGGRYHVKADPPLVGGRGDLTAGKGVSIPHPPGSGGYGDPAARDPALVRRDLAEDRISVETAKDTHGVVD